MKWRPGGTFRRLVVGGGRWSGPGRLSVVVLALSAATVLGGGVGVMVWATRTVAPARTLAWAATVLPDPPALDSALEVTWTWSVGGTDALEDRWLTLVSPTLPPGICAPGTAPEAGGEEDLERPAGSDLALALRQLDQAVVRGGGPEELERRIEDLREVGTAAPGSRTDFLVRYNLARGHAAAGDWAGAADVLDPSLEGWISPRRLPEVDRAGAASLVARGGVDQTSVLDAVHGRYLAATVAYRRGEVDRAVAWFRRTINAFHYLLALRRDQALGPEAHEQRVAAGLGASRCPGSRADEALTSLDAYAGLVAAYMAHESFRDPGGLRGEVARSRLEIDPGDPFLPVLEHARRTGGDPARTPIPENLLWAASNLQRVYHSNRLRPEPRLEVTRAVLLLHLTGDERRVRALEADGGAEICSMLSGLGADLRRDTGGDRPRREGASEVDSARAAVAVQTFARLERDCPDAGTVPVEAEVRSVWIREGGQYLTRGVGGAYETMRADIEGALRDPGAAVPVMEERLLPIVDRIRVHRTALNAGRVPAELPADVPVEPVSRFVEEWRRALWYDVATALAARVRVPDPERPVRAGEVPRLLRSLESAVRHAGLRPREVYGVDETAALARTGGTTAELEWRFRTWVGNRPGVAAATLAGGVLIALLGALSVHLTVWRYRLLVLRRLYRIEAAAGRRRRGLT